MKKESLSDKEIIKEVFKTYEDEKYRRQFNNATKMMEDLIKKTLKEKDKIINEKVKEAQGKFESLDMDSFHNPEGVFLDLLFKDKIREIFLEVFGEKLT